MGFREKCWHFTDFIDLHHEFWQTFIYFHRENDDATRFFGDEENPFWGRDVIAFAFL